MCGVAGSLSREPTALTGHASFLLTRALAHRGPDGEGFWRAGPDGSGLCHAVDLERPSQLVLGHRRLSIVDIEGGFQPMSNEDGSVWVSFNGEIYNHLDLRRVLEGRGHVFRTRADTEVLVHGWEEWGESLFGRLNGIFAFALADTRRGELVLVRDPLGVKSLYVGVHGAITWWASELAAARDAGLVAETLSADALKLFLTFRFIPSPHAIFEHAWKLPPGHFVRLQPNDAGDPPRFRPYECRIRSSAEPRTRSEWQEALVGTLDAAVERQLMSDVPVGTLLSGGVDSSLVSSMMALRLDEPPQAFAIGFASDGAASEVEAAARAANALGLPLTKTVVEDDDYIRAWPEALAWVGEPIANSGALLLSLLCAEVGRTHKVVLTGQGADEPLGGYPRHAIERLYTIGRRAPRLAGLLAQSVFRSDSGQRLSRALSVQDRLDRFVRVFAVIPPEEVDALVHGASGSASELARAAVERWAAPTVTGDSLNELLRIDARLSLADDLLVVADHFSMRASVELRVPFLDLELMELVERMPSIYKVSRTGQRKWLYRRAAAQRLPSSLRRELCGTRARHGRKRGFSAPLERWFQSSDGPLATPGTWAAPLEEIEALVPEVVRATTNEMPGGSRARQRLALYSLSVWAQGTPLTQPLALEAV